jgi:diaminohydroxyphosphoribosylaminopyrimidine deaminase/5-amino-6-(5-phosphoribosylamino)uracil reductase
MIDERPMREAIALAAMAGGRTRPNPRVGCVIVAPTGAILGRGFHHQAGQPHAEVEALRDAARRGHTVAGATAYVTLEPCNHHGRTPPCSLALIDARIARVVVAVRDPNPAARGGVERLRAAGIEVHVGICRAEAMALNPAFLVRHALGRPLVTLKWAMTADGCTAVPGGDSRWITSEEARREVHRQRAAHDAVLAGIGTVVRDGARLTTRLPEGDPDLPPPAVTPWRVVLDTGLRIDAESPFLAPAPPSRALVITGPGAQRDRRAAIEATGAELAEAPAGPDGIEPAGVLALLAARGAQSVYIEGGRRVAGSFLAAGLVDRVEAWIAPRLALGSTGGHLGPTASPAPPARMADAVDLHDVQFSTIGPDAVMRGWITRLDGLDV